LRWLRRRSGGRSRGSRRNRRAAHTRERTNKPGSQQSKLSHSAVSIHSFPAKSR
jgi:hypothetical protein